LRRLALLAAVLALTATSTAAAGLQPLRRDTRENPLPRVRAGVLHPSAQHRSGLLRVIVTLAQPPLAAMRPERSLFGAVAPTRLDVHTATSRAYVAKLARAQRVEAAAIVRAIPRAQIQQRFRILLDGITVRLPSRSLATLARVPGVAHVYPSLGYYATMDRGPSVIHASDLTAATGDGGQGVKIAIVDTGIDQTNPFLSPAGFAYPPGFPKGDVKRTTPKVIVARVFPGAIRDARSNKAFDPTEPHGTHVAGIAAGDAGTNAPAGSDHPAVANLSGVAPKAWLGNYRVFTEPTPLGHEADTPEIVQAFEAAVADGMNVINFSGGGPQTDPANDALVVAVHNVARAGVVPVIAAGNDRDDFGLGTAASPGTAPDAISVAAVSNAHVFAPALIVQGAPSSLATVPIQIERIPQSWTTVEQPLIDVTSILGTDGKPVDKYLCGSPADPEGTVGTIPKGSLGGLIVLVSRGECSFVSKGLRAAYAGAVGMILVDNRPGEANPIPVEMPLPTGMISDLDGANLRAFMAANRGYANIHLTSGIEELPTNRAGVITSFSSAGPTDFGGALKPDIAAPGLDVLSSVPAASVGSPFAVFAGTSMATPHIAGAAALLLQRHPQWTPWNVKSALMSTAGPAWADTARTQEASVLLEGAGLADVAAADTPRLFTDPQSLSFGHVDVSTGTQAASQLLTVTDAGGGAGDWSVTIEAQTQTTGVAIEVPPRITVAPGGDVSVPVVVHALETAGTGVNGGFIVFTQGAVQRRVPYEFLVERPALEKLAAVELKRDQAGSTGGTSHVSAYCCPSEPFGPPAFYTGAPMNENGSEHLYELSIDQPVVNFGVSVLLASNGSLVDPWVLGSKDENDVQGYSATPTDINPLTFDFGADVGAAGVQFPRLQRLYVAVDSQAHTGSYLLRAWVDDVVPPGLRLVTTHVSAGRPVVVAQAFDSGSGVDPLSLVFNYGQVLVGASAFDPVSGLAVFTLPPNAPALRAGKRGAILFANDYQETKNVNSVGGNLLPNSTFQEARLNVVNGPAVTWLSPQGGCSPRTVQLLAVGSSTARAAHVVFADHGRTIARLTRNAAGVYATTWHATTGEHALTVTLVDANGRTATASRRVNVCG